MGSRARPREDESREACPEPGTHREAVDPFETWDYVEAVAEEIDDHYGPTVIFAAATGLRPAEWIGLEWRNVDREHRVAYVEQALARDSMDHALTKLNLIAGGTPTRRKPQVVS